MAAVNGDKKTDEQWRKFELFRLIRCDRSGLLRSSSHYLSSCPSALRGAAAVFGDPQHQKPRYAGITIVGTPAEELAGVCIRGNNTASPRGLLLISSEARRYDASESRFPYRSKPRGTRQRRPSMADQAAIRINRIAPVRTERERSNEFLTALAPIFTPSMFPLDFG